MSNNGFGLFAPVTIGADQISVFSWPAAQLREEWVENASLEIAGPMDGVTMALGKARDMAEATVTSANRFPRLKAASKTIKGGRGHTAWNDDTLFP